MDILDRILSSVAVIAAAAKPEPLYDVPVIFGLSTSVRTQLLRPMGTEWPELGEPWLEPTWYEDWQDV